MKFMKTAMSIALITAMSTSHAFFDSIPLPSLSDNEDKKETVTRTDTAAAQVSEDDMNCKNMTEEFGEAEGYAKGLLGGATAGIGSFLTSGSTTAAAFDAAKAAAKEANWLPPAVEKAVWTELLSEQINDKQIFDRKSAAAKRFYKKADAILEKVLKGYGQDVSRNSDNEFETDSMPYAIKILVKRDTRAEGKALPGGYIIVTHGLLNKPDLAAFIISHEVSHLAKRHESRAFQAMLVDSLESVQEISNLKDVAGNIGQAQGVISELVRNKVQFITMHEHQEHAADSCGIKSLAKSPEFSDEDVKNAAKAFKDLVSVNKSSDKPKNFEQLMSAGIVSHPPSDERKKYIDEFLNKHL